MELFSLNLKNPNPVFIFLLIFQSIFLVACNIESKSVQEEPESWSVTLIYSGGITGREEKIMLQNDGRMQFVNLIQNTTSNFKINDNNELNLIKSLINSAHKSDKNVINQSDNINIRCNDCLITTISYTINAVNYVLDKKNKTNGKLIFNELQIKLNKLLTIQINNKKS